jgi:hypothetical protein
MTSAAQLAANKANARKSTGPRTAEGKARSSKNHTTHGLRSREFIIPEGQQQDFDDFMTALRNGIQPAGALEHDLFTQLAHASWTLRRCRESEAALQRRGAAPDVDPLLSPDCQDRLRLIDLYARRAERTYLRLLRELKSLQTSRQFREECLGAAGEDDAPAPLSDDLALQRPRLVESKLQTDQACARTIAEISAHIDEFPSAITNERSNPPASVAAVAACA